MGASPILMMFAALAVGAVVLAAVSFVDVVHHRIPNAITYPSIVLCGVIAVLGPAAGHDDRVVAALVGAVAFGLLLYVPHRHAPDAMGLGDVKLALPLGFSIGWVHADAGMTLLLVGWTLAAASAIGLVMAAIAAWSRGKRIKAQQAVAFGPALSIATSCAVVAALV